jgi:hypothetical protein
VSLHELFAARNALHRTQHLKALEHIDCSVCWLTYADLKRLGFSMSHIKYFVKSDQLKCRHPGKGQQRALFHPDDVAEFLVARAERLHNTIFGDAVVPAEVMARAKALTAEVMSTFLSRTKKCSKA